jgi:hypothetical protein
LSGGQVAGQHALVGADDAHPCVHPGLIRAVEKPVGACQPAAHGRHQGGVEQQVHGDADSCVGGRDRIAGAHERGVAPLPGPDRDVQVARRVGGLCEHGQIGRRQETVRVRLHEEVERLLPVALRRGGARAVDRDTAGVLGHRTPPQPWPVDAQLARHRP